MRRYGFHGTSHQYVTAKAAELLGKPVDQVDLVTLHLGNGASISAIKKGELATDRLRIPTPQPAMPQAVAGVVKQIVETKNAKIGPGAKVPHLSYAGDVEIGENANIGAGTIFANYDGVTKSTSVIGKASFVGSNSVIVAPVVVADGAYVAAGSAITEPVGPGELAVARGRQRNIPGWVAKRREGTKTHQAALEAGDNEGTSEQ